MKKNRGTTKKKYECDITPQNNPDIGSKRLLHIFSCFWLLINCVLLARLLPDIRNVAIGLAFVSVFYAIIHLIDQRKENWVWWGMIFWAVFSFSLPIVIVSLFNLYWYLAVIAVQIIVSAVIFFIYKKK